jgi:hypothetical protein
MFSCNNKKEQVVEDYFQIPKSFFTLVSPEGPEININLCVRYDRIEVWGKTDSTDKELTYSKGSITGSVYDYSKAMKTIEKDWDIDKKDSTPVMQIYFEVTNIGQDQKVMFYMNDQTVFEIQVKDHWVTGWAYPPYRIKN